MCVHHPTVINNIANLEFPTLNKLVRAECSYTESCIPLKWICEVKSMSLLEDAIFDDEDPDDEMLQPEIVPECLSSNLKLFSIINYRELGSFAPFLPLPEARGMVFRLLDDTRQLHVNWT
ncbi:hypothetical protein RIF29_19167 [Crotalaria pallida]|uniref:Uncharacterized protein n=1 Tax=Crotalaria pallida TaxID=3830 RepID=A0AAN9F1I1_CROPI